MIPTVKPGLSESGGGHMPGPSVGQRALGAASGKGYDQTGTKKDCV